MLRCFRKCLTSSQNLAEVGTRLPWPKSWIQKLLGIRSTRDNCIPTVQNAIFACDQTLALRARVWPCQTTTQPSYKCCTTLCMRNACSTHTYHVRGDQKTGKYWEPIFAWIRAPGMRIFGDAYIHLTLAAVLCTISRVFEVRTCAFSVWKSGWAKIQPAQPLATAMCEDSTQWGCKGSSYFHSDYSW